jgi:outer membrane protein TolC
MRTQIYKQLLLTFVALCGAILAQSQQRPDSLMHYLEVAARNNPAVLQKFSEYQAALQKAPQVGSLPDPELNVGVFLSPMEILGGNQIADIKLMQMFPWFGVLKNAKDEMSLMAKSKYESFRDTKLQVFLDVQRSWYLLNKLQQDIRISEKNLEVLRTIERLALGRFKSLPAGSAGISPSRTTPTSSTPSATGSSSMQVMGGNASNAEPKPAVAMQSGGMGAVTTGSGLADLYRIQIEIGDIENSIELLKNQQATSMAKFNSLLGRLSNTSIVLPDSLKTENIGMPVSVVSDSILSNNPMLGMLQYEKQSLEARTRMVSRMGYPMVGLGVNYSVISKNAMSTSSMNGKDMVMPMVTVTLPIYRKKYKAMQTEASLLKTATEQSYSATANSLQAEYYEALQLYQDSQRRVKLYTNQSQLAKRSLDIMVKGFSASTSSLSDVLRIRQQLFDYELKQVEALTDYNTSIAWLKRLMAHPQVN